MSYFTRSTFEGPLPCLAGRIAPRARAALVSLLAWLAASGLQAQEPDAGEAPAAPDAAPAEDTTAQLADASAPDDAGVASAGDGSPAADTDAAPAEHDATVIGAAPPAVVAAPLPAATAAPATLEVTVRARLSEAQQLQQSAEAVHVIDTRKARLQSADLGEVLARTQGIGVRRDGGLGSNGTISLNGLQEDQVRLFLDGVPLQLAGYPFGLVNIPVNLVERVEVYRGVVPIRFGADALGGAIHVVSDRSYDTHLGASYQVGSFGTHRATLNGRYRHAPTGFIVGGAAFFDVAENDFLMHDREIANDDGSTVTRTTRRFHDAYRAWGANLELGVVDRRWAKRLLVQGFASSFDKEMQHNAVMSTPFGEITHGESIAGATARYEVALGPKLELEALANYSFRDIRFTDLTRYVYSWEGERLGTIGRDRGLLPGGPYDKSTYEDTLYGRLGLSWTIAPEHVLRASVTPSMILRSGDDHVEERPDLLHLDQRLKQAVAGAEYELNCFDERLSNIAFVKGYFFSASAEDRHQGTGTVFARHRRIQRVGGGDALRFRFSSWLIGKASYEYTIRLPRADELFGDGRLIEASANMYNDKLLQPELSHNVNVGPRLDLKRTRAGAFMLDVNAFLRESEDMIVLLAGKQFIPYANISDARTRGLESAWSWVSPGRWLSTEGAFTWQDVRNTATTGAFALQKGLRVPSRPWMFASWGGRVHIPKLPGGDDSLEPFYYGRYVHEFSRGWAIGAPEFRTGVPAQISHTLGLTWLLSGTYGKLATTFEVSNLTDARLYDVYGVERPGRAFYLKLTGQL